MPKKGDTEEQIVSVLRQVEAGARVAEICRKVGIGEATYYRWKRQYSGVGVSELRGRRQLREENGRALRHSIYRAVERAGIVAEGISLKTQRRMT
ncbi:MAG: transposase [Terriglobales bacterium]